MKTIKTIKAIAVSLTAAMLLSAAPATAFAETNVGAAVQYRLGDANMDVRVDVTDASGVQLHAAAAAAKSVKKAARYSAASFFFK